MLGQCLMFLWWDSLLKIVPMCIIFPNMSIHVVTMFAMFTMSIQAITIEIEYKLIWVQSYFCFQFYFSFILLYRIRSQLCKFLLKFATIIKSSKFPNFNWMSKGMSFVIPILTHFDLFENSLQLHRYTKSLDFISNPNWT
jgi:hypothetical protein